MKYFAGFFRVGALTRSQAPLLALLVVQACLIGQLAWELSPTGNEPGHLVAGISYWRTGTFGLYSVNPPLVRLFAGLPAALLSPWDSPQLRLSGMTVVREEYALGSEFFRFDPPGAYHLLRLGRICCLPFALLGTAVSFCWAKDRFGLPAGWIAASLWAFSPMTMSHSALITSDAHGAALGLLAGYSFDRWLRAPTWHATLWSGLTLGVAELAKTTLIILMPLWPIIWLIVRWPHRGNLGSRWWVRELMMLVTRTMLTIAVINLGYLWEGTLTPLRDYALVSDAFTSWQSKGGADWGTSLPGPDRIPIPLPYHYVSGMDHQQASFESHDRLSYLHGELCPRSDLD